MLRLWKRLFGHEFNMVFKYSFRPLPKIVRVNRLKSNVGDFRKIAKKYSWKLKSVDVLSNVFEIKTNGDENFNETGEYLKGLFYFQQLSSMLPVIALRPKPGEKILDIGAAPGSKTTQIGELMKNKGEIVANDIDKERLKILKKTVKRMGIRIVKFHLGKGEDLGEKYPENFDRVLVDAPCSSEGIIRYKTHKLIEWNQPFIEKTVFTQKLLIESGFNALKPGGILIYSTCTYNSEENEGVIDYLLQRHSNAKVLITKFKNIKTRPGLLKWEGTQYDKRVSKAVRIYPQDINSTGFFICKITKVPK